MMESRDGCRAWLSLVANAQVFPRRELFAVRCDACTRQPIRTRQKACLPNQAHAVAKFGKPFRLAPPTKPIGGTCPAATFAPGSGVVVVQVR